MTSKVITYYIIIDDIDNGTIIIYFYFYFYFYFISIFALLLFCECIIHLIVVDGVYAVAPNMEINKKKKKKKVRQFVVPSGAYFIF